MKVPLADLIDRYTILVLKAERIGTEAIIKEKDFYEDEVRKCPYEISSFIRELLEVNNSIWLLEAQLKSGRDQELPLEEIGRRAIMIRDYNKKRLEIKNRITALFGDAMPEVKKDHVSE